MGSPAGGQLAGGEHNRRISNLRISFPSPLGQLCPIPRPTAYQRGRRRLTVQLEHIMSAELSTFRTGDTVRLVNSHGSKVVGVNCRGRRILTPNPTTALVTRDGPYETPSGLTMVDLRILDGPYRSRTAEAHVNVVRLVAPETAAAQRPLTGMLRRALNILR